jgi:hypothetical protein
MPPSIIQRANEVLSLLESEGSIIQGSLKKKSKIKPEEQQFSFGFFD